MDPSYSSSSSPELNPLIAGEFPVKDEGVTLLQGTNYLAGSVLGQITLGAASSAAKAGGNTGNGTLTLDATAPVRPGAKAGVYTVRCIAAATDSGTFRVEDPDGNVLGDVAVGATFDDDIKFVIADGGTDFVVGDGFDVTIAAGSKKYKLAAAAAIDGSAKARRILAKAVDATSADKKGPVYATGEFDKSKLVFGAGHSAATVEEDLRAENIYLVDTLPA